MTYLPERAGRDFKYDSRNKQKGVATLVTAVVLMLAVFGISYFASETVINEKQIASNEFRSKQAFMAAQAGIDYGRAVAIDGLCVPGSPCSPPTDIGGGSFNVQIVSSAAGSIYTIESTGVSEDGSVERMITYAIGKLPGEGYPPNVPIVARGGLGLTGNVKAVNNEESLTVWSGNDFGLNGSANTYIKIDDNVNQLSSIKNPGGNNVYGPDVLTNDPNLGNATESELLEAFFNKSSIEEFSETYATGCTTGNCLENIDDMASYDVSNYGDYANKVYYSDTDYTIGNSSVPQGTIPEASLTEWEALTNSDPDRNDLLTSGSVTGANLKFDNTTILGSPSDPVTIVVKGKLTLNSSPTIFGIIICEELEVKGSPIIIGGVVVLDQDADAMTGNGTPTIIMDKVVMQQTKQSDIYGPVKNSWKDW